MIRSLNSDEFRRLVRTHPQFFVAMFAGVDVTEGGVAPNAKLADSIRDNPELPAAICKIVDLQGATGTLQWIFAAAVLTQTLAALGGPLFSLLLADELAGIFSGPTGGSSIQ